MSANTPGPWAFRFNGHYFDIITVGVAPYRGDIASVPQSECINGITREEAAANACLFAAAPDLLTAAKYVETWWLEQGMRESNGAPACIFAIRAAIAKATQA